MKTYIFVILFLLSAFKSNAQVYYQMYYDPEHFATVTANQAMRMSTEGILTNQTDKIKENINDINKNVVKFVLVKDMVYRYLTEVNEALKDGKQMKYIVYLINDIIKESQAVVDEVSDAPQYAVFALNSVESLRYQSLAIFSEISRLINKGGVEAMMDNSTRDEIITDICDRLRIMRGALFGIQNSIKWAKLRGFWTSLNPFRIWVNQDKLIIYDILRSYNYVTR
jgi:hypothetical protein